ncbi:LytR/AlgR family response regulator transcription factor [Parapedobacter sp. GCM10030251]|uniref:LytR/AlgR family response regulator transcription factor n=1 Tax=Parapedobacter sp. GCM10030251 TaxID=3273419 RepID=UPI003623C256
MKAHEEHRYFVKNANQFSVVKCENILYCIADKGYTILYTTEDEKYMISKSLTKFLSEVQYPYLIRISQSVLVNIQYVKHVHNKEKCVVLKNGEKLYYTLSYGELQAQIVNLHNNRKLSQDG